jgi:succinoglycan biosynthesis protein ExoV
VKLEYFQARPGNFGDELNPWLWPKLLPGLHASGGPDDPHLIGIGSILDARYDRLRGRKVVFGSGARLAAPAAPRDPSWDIRFVRGPLTAAALGLAPEAAITDGAAALALLNLQRAPGASGVAFMPHYRTLQIADWPRICADAKVRLIDPTRPVPQVLEAISGVDRLIAEAMHGAIIADLLRVPWVRVRCHGHFLEGAGVSEFKWADWGQSLGVGVEPAAFVSLPPLPRSLVKRAVHYPGRLWNRASLGGALAKVAGRGHFRLSESSRLHQAVERIGAQVSRLGEELRGT